MLVFYYFLIFVESAKVNKMLIILHFYMQYYLRMSLKGGKRAAFGALIRIKCVNVDTTLPIFIGA